MISVFNRRVAPVLLSLQVTCIGLFTLLITALPPDTAELDHTGPTALDHTGPVARDTLYGAILLGIVIALVGAAAILGLEVIRARIPWAVRVGWLGAVALGQIAVAARALLNVYGQDTGPDMVFGVAVAVAATGVAAACAVEARASAPVRTQVPA